MRQHEDSRFILGGNAYGNASRRKFCNFEAFDPDQSRLIVPLSDVQLDVVAFFFMTEQTHRTFHPKGSKFFLE